MRRLGLLQAFFRRSGALLALFHCLASTDVHQENVIAAGDQPVPVDFEMVLQASVEEHKTGDPDALAFEAALEGLGNYVLMVGLFPVYGRPPGNEILAAGGLISNWKPSARRVIWHEPNSDTMRPENRAEMHWERTNLPRIEGGRYAKFSDHLADFIGGFEGYANFLLERRPLTTKARGAFLTDSITSSYAEFSLRRASTTCSCSG